MAFVAAKASKFSLDNAGGSPTDISAYIDSVSGISNTTDMLDTTVFGQDSKSYAPGLRNGDVINITGGIDEGIAIAVIADGSISGRGRASISRVIGVGSDQPECLTAGV